MVIESSFALPGLSGAAIGAGPPDLRYVRATAAPETLHGPEMTAGFNWSRDLKVCHFNAPGVAVFQITRDGIVSVWALTDDVDDIAAYLVGSVLGIALHLRRIVTLHASAVEVDGGAVLFCGESGAGKSTMAAALQKRGYSVLSDDLCAIEMTPEGAIMHSDGRKIKLWDDAIGKLELRGERGKPVQKGFEKYFVDAGVGEQHSAPVRFVFELAYRERMATPTVSAVPAADAASLIRHNAYRPFLVEQLKDEGMYFNATVALLRQSRIMRLERAHDLDKIDVVVEALLAQL